MREKEVEVKKYIIQENILALLIEQLDMTKPTTKEFIFSVVNSNIKLYEDPKVETLEADKE